MKENEAKILNDLKRRVEIYHYLHNDLVENQVCPVYEALDAMPKMVNYDDLLLRFRVAWENNISTLRDNYFTTDQDGGFVFFSVYF